MDGQLIDSDQEADEYTPQQLIVYPKNALKAIHAWGAFGSGYWGDLLSSTKRKVKAKID